MITIEATNVGQVTKDIRELIIGINKWGKPIKKSMQLLREEQRDNFRQQGAIYQGGGFVRAGGAFVNGGGATTRGKSWQKLAESTKKQRKKLGYGASRPILERTGKLKNGFRITKSNDDEGVIENNVSYAKYHQTGTKKMPQRRIMGFSNKSVAAIRIEFLNHIKGYLKRFK